MPEIVMTPSFEVAAIGLGSLGSAVALSLARRGASVISFDRCKPPHRFGSHGSIGADANPGCGARDRPRTKLKS